jgi:hypothetical protein
MRSQPFPVLCSSGAKRRPVHRRDVAVLRSRCNSEVFDCQQYNWNRLRSPEVVVHQVSMWRLSPSTDCGAVRARSSVARPRSPIFTMPCAPLMKMLSHLQQQFTYVKGQRTKVLLIASTSTEVTTMIQDKCRVIEGCDRASLQVAVDNGRRVAVQVHQAAQDLPRPPLQHLLVDLPVPLAVPAQHRNLQMGTSTHPNPADPAHEHKLSSNSRRFTTLPLNIDSTE